MPLPNGGRLRLVIENAPAESVNDLGELFEVIDNLIQEEFDQAGCDLEIKQPEAECAFTKALKERSE